MNNIYLNSFDENIKYDPTPIYYVYMYMRGKDSKYGPKNSPYYIGKGKYDRAYVDHIRQNSLNMTPKDADRIKFIIEAVDEETAYMLETYWIQYFGRIDLNTGCLRNLTDGGIGGLNPSENTRRKMSEAKIDNIPWNKGLTKTDDSRILQGQAHREAHGPVPDNIKNQISKTLKDKNNHWYNNGVEESCIPECPIGWQKGRLLKTGLGKHWYTNNIENIFCFDSDKPEGWLAGKTGLKYNQKSYIAINPDGIKYIIEKGKLKEFCSQHNLIVSSLMISARTNKPITQRKCKGWSCIFS